MSETKFTPGPWHSGCFVKNREGGCQCRSILHGGAAGSVAQISMHNGIDRATDGSNECPPLAEAIANSHLIAAAPDMYEALEMLLANAAMYNRDSDEVWLSIKKQAESVLAKARGEQQ